MKKAIALILCLLLALPMGAQADISRQLTLNVNDAAFVLDFWDNGLQLTTPHGQGAAYVQDGRLFFTMDGQTQTMPQLLDGMPAASIAKIRALNGFAEYVNDGDGCQELEELFAMVADRLPAIADYIGWQDKGNGVIEIQHSMSSMLTILCHFIVNELMDSSMIAWLNESTLNGVWQEHGTALAGEYAWYTGLPLGIVAYVYLLQLPLNVYSSYLPEEPVTIRLYRDENARVQKVEAAFGMTEDEMRLDVSATLSAEGLQGEMTITYTDEPGLEDTAKLNIWPQDGKWMADFALCLPSEDESGHLWGSAALTEDGPDVLFLCDLPDAWKNASLRLTNNKLYFNVLHSRYGNDISLVCDWTDKDYQVYFSTADASYDISGTYSLLESANDKHYSQTFTVMKNSALLLEGEYNGDFAISREKITTELGSMVLYNTKTEYTLQGKAYNAVDAAAMSGAEVTEGEDPLFKLLEALTGEHMQSEYDFCLQYTPVRMNDN